MECVFCNLNNEKIIRQTNNTITLLSNPYLIIGHSLVIPKFHVEKLSQLQPEIRYELIDEVVKVQELLIEKLNASGVDVRQNYRPFIHPGRLKVNHLHIHVIPRYFEDNLYQKSMIYEKQVFVDLTSQLTKSLMEKLT